MQRLLADPALRAFYRERLESITNQFVNPGWMTPRVDDMVALIRDAVLEDTKRRGGDDPATAAQTFDDAVTDIRSVIEDRAAHVTAQLHAAGRRRTVRH